MKSLPSVLSAVSTSVLPADSTSVLPADWSAEGSAKAEALAKEELALRSRAVGGAKEGWPRRPGMLYRPTRRGGHNRRLPLAR